MKDAPEQTAFYSELGANIREHRKALNLSQDALARMVGLTRTSLTNIENGRQHPPLHTFCEIVEQLKIDASNLLPNRTVSKTPDGIDVEAIATRQTRNPDELAFITTAIGRKN